MNLERVTSSERYQFPLKALFIPRRTHINSLQIFSGVGVSGAGTCKSSVELEYRCRYLQFFSGVSGAGTCKYSMKEYPVQVPVNLRWCWSIRCRYLQIFGGVGVSGAGTCKSSVKLEYPVQVPAPDTPTPPKICRLLRTTQQSQTQTGNDYAKETESPPNTPQLPRLTGQASRDIRFEI